MVVPIPPVSGRVEPELLTTSVLSVAEGSPAPTVTVGLPVLREAPSALYSAVILNSTGLLRRLYPSGAFVS